MKRFLPFLIIAIVALLTVGIATAIYRAKMRPATPVAATPVPAASTPAAGASAGDAAAVATPTPEGKEDPSLHVRGPRTAPVTVEVYGDFQCPSCGHSAGIMKELEAQYHDQLRVIFYEFPLAMHQHAMEAAMAAEAAGVQGKFWEMHDLLYQYQAVWSKVSDVSQFFGSYAESIGLDVARFNADRQSPDIRQRVMSQGEAGTARGVKNTPTIFLNGNEVRAGFTRDSLQQAIEAARTPKKGS